MRIAILGYTHSSDQNSVRIGQSWSLQGHSVKFFNFNSPVEQTVAQIKLFNPKFLLVTMGRDYPHAQLRELEIPLINWIPDEYGPGVPPGGMWFEEVKGIYDLFLVQVRGIVPLLKDYAKEVVWVPMFFDTLYHMSTTKRGEWATDLGFLGDPSTEQSSIRTKFLRLLIKDEYKLVIGGSQWGKYTEKYWQDVDPRYFIGFLVNGQMTTFYRQSKIALNFVNDNLPSYDLGFSNRAFKVVGSGGFLLTQEIPGLSDLLTPGKHCATYSPMDYLDLKKQIAYHLSNEVHREEIARAGMQHIHKNYNIDNITRHFIDIIRQKCGI